MTEYPARRRAPRHIWVALVSLVTVSLLAGCGSSGSSTTGAASAKAATSVSTPLSGSIVVFAAASLKGVFATLGAQFERAHPGTKVTFNFGPSSGLATQITQGAPADVFAAASAKSMDQVVRARAATSATSFASNVMQIAVPPQNPAGISRLTDLARPGVKVAVCQAAVPCGVTAARVFATARLAVTPVTEEVDVKAVLAKVTLGEVDAGVVYVTDVLAAQGKVRGIAIPADVNASTTYPIATLNASTNMPVAQAFSAYVRSAEGARVLARAGFAKP